jgi:hypothetical protein
VREDVKKKPVEIKSDATSVTESLNIDVIMRGKTNNDG